MTLADRGAFRVTPRWFTELNIGTFLLLSAGVTVYPWAGSTSILALLVAASLVVVGVFMLLHAVRLAKHSQWRWLKAGTTDEKVVFPKERATPIVIAFLLFASVISSAALRPGRWFIVLGGGAFSFLLFIGWRSRN